MLTFRWQQLENDVFADILDLQPQLRTHRKILVAFGSNQPVADTQKQQTFVVDGGNASHERPADRKDRLLRAQRETAGARENNKGVRSGHTWLSQP